MTCKYFFHNSEDTINYAKLTYAFYTEFIKELQVLNQQYNFSIYLHGSYVGYLTNQTPYNDIDFFITAKKLLDTDVLIRFFKDFHGLCKRFNLPYEIFYTVDVTDDDVIFNPTIPEVFNVEQTTTLRLYKHRIFDNGLPEDNEDAVVLNSELYSSVYHPRSRSKKQIKKMTRQTKYIKPIKIV